MLPNKEKTREEIEEHVKNELILLNRSMIDKATEIVTNGEPETDLWPQFREANAAYKRRRSEILELINPKPVVIDLKPKAEPENSYSFKHVIPEEDVCIMWPLSPTLQTHFQISPVATGAVIRDEQATTLRSALINLLVQGESLYQYNVKAVVKILPDTVVKISKHSDTTELHALDHIHQHSQQIPVPLPLGMIRIGTWCYVFTSFVQGITLDRIWANLASDKKCRVRDQLDRIFTELRRLPRPSEEGYLGAGKPPTCQAGFRFRNSSSSPIENESQFNKFLLKESWLEPARINYIFKDLQSNHKIVMTHGDLCPVNILVESEDTAHISGIVDWEAAGAYPEYWEYVNAFKSTFDSRDDWCLYLPEAGIGRFFDEYIKHNFIGKFT